METLRETNLVDNEVNKIIQFLEKEIVEKITFKELEEEFKNHDIQIIKDNIAKKEQCYFDLILERILNYYLDKLIGLNCKDYFEVTQSTYINEEWEMVPKIYLQAQQLIDDIMECFDPCKKYTNVYEDAEHIAYSLMRKKLNIKGHSVPKTLKLEYIKTYSISYSISVNELDNEIWYMILYIATHYYVLKSIL